MANGWFDAASNVCMMSDALFNLAVRVTERESDAILGWRAGNPVRTADFVQRMWAWCALLRRQRGANFALYLDDGIEFGAALLGAWQAGKTIWLNADTLDASCAALRGAVDGFLGECPAACAPLLPSAADAVASGVALALAADFGALVVHTSGSTGAAQAIPKRLAQLGSEVATLEALFGAQIGTAAVVATVSHQHIYGLLFKVLWPLCARRPIVAHSVRFPEQLAQLLAVRPSVLVASPAHLKRLPVHLDWKGARLHAIFSSGGPLAQDAAQASAQLLGKVPIEIYGSSETGGIAWRQRVAGSDESWLALPGVAWRLAGAGPSLEVRSAHLAHDHWLLLADRARSAGAERFLLLGRSDRIVKIEEKRISLDAIEAALMRCDLVIEARVLLCDALPGERQKLAAFIVASGSGRTVLADGGKLAMNGLLRAALGGAIDAVALPRRWRYLEQLPVDAQGKTKHEQLLDLLGDGAQLRPHLRLLQHDAQMVVL